MFFFKIMNKQIQNQIIQMSEIAIKARQKAGKKEKMTIENYQVFMIDQLNLFLLKKFIRRNGYPKKGNIQENTMFHFAHLLKDVSELDPLFVIKCLKNSYIPKKYREQINSLMEFHKK